jgi:rare lipoprotein A
MSEFDAARVRGGKTGAGAWSLAILASIAVPACGGPAEEMPPAAVPSVEAPAAPPAVPPRTEAVQIGEASWYGARLAGHRTASGERFDPSRMTAAHRTLPLGTWVEVTSLATRRRVRVRINDRGPFGHEERIIDLSRAAADKLAIRKAGVARVEVRVVSGP